MPFRTALDWGYDSGILNIRECAGHHACRRVRAAWECLFACRAHAGEHVTRQHPHRKVTKHRRAPSILGPAMVLVVVLAAVLVGVLLFGGKGSANKPADKPSVEEPTPAPTEPLTLDQTTLNMNQGETATLTVTGAENVLWTSSDPNVATVDDSGTVTAGVPGTATITVTTADGSQSAACTVQVATPLPPEPPKEELGLRSIYQAKGETISEFSTSVGAAVQMRVDGTEQTITWTIEDPKIATVTADGLVTGVAKGKTVLKATVGDQSVSCFVIVN